MTFEKIFVAGHRGMVGSAICRHLLASGIQQHDLITCSRSDLNLVDQGQVFEFFQERNLIRFTFVQHGLGYSCQQ